MLGGRWVVSSKVVHDFGIAYMDFMIQDGLFRWCRSARDGDGKVNDTMVYRHSLN